MPGAGSEPPGRSRLIVAIDGPAGAGKSTVARAVALRLGLRYLDTGAMYRAVTWAALTRSVPVDGPKLGRLVEAMQLVVSTDPQAPSVQVDGIDVSTLIRGPAVTAAVSAVSALPAVRDRLRDRQRAIVGGGGIVVEGRDIGSVVLPEAPVKVFLTASAGARARRRSVEQTDGRAPGDTGAVEATQAELARRDAWDTARAASPLTRAADAVELDSTALSIEQVVAAVLALVPVEARL